MDLIDITKQECFMSNVVIKYMYVTRCVLRLHTNTLFKRLIVAAYSSVNDAHAMQLRDEQYLFC